MYFIQVLILFKVRGSLFSWVLYREKFWSQILICLNWLWLLIEDTRTYVLMNINVTDTLKIWLLAKLWCWIKKTQKHTKHLNAYHGQYHLLSRRNIFPRVIMVKTMRITVVPMMVGWVTRLVSCGENDEFIKCSSLIRAFLILGNLLESLETREHWQNWH